MGQKSLWIFAPRSKTYKRREQKQHYALLRSQQLLRAKALRVEGPSEISRNSPKITEQFSKIPSYFSELNASVPTSFILLFSQLVAYLLRSQQSLRFESGHLLVNPSRQSLFWQACLQGSMFGRRHPL